eukprot:gene6776-biopygen1128
MYACSGTGRPTSEKNASRRTSGPALDAVQRHDLVVEAVRAVPPRDGHEPRVDGDVAGVVVAQEVDEVGVLRHPRRLPYPHPLRQRAEGHRVPPAGAHPAQ